MVLLIDPHQEGLIVIVPGGGAQSSLLPGLWSQGTSRKKPLGGPQSRGTSQVPGVLIPAVPRSGGRCPDSSPVNSLGARREARTAQRGDRKRGLSCFPSLPIRYCVVPTKGIRGRGSQHSPPTGGCAVAGRGSPRIHAQCEQELVSPPPPPPTRGSVCVTQHLTDSPRGSGWERRENKKLQLPRGGWRRKANTTAPPTSKILRG